MSLRNFATDPTPKKSAPRRKKPIASWQIGDFPQAVILLFKAHDTLGYAEDQFTELWNRPLPKITATVAPQKREEIRSDLFRCAWDLDKTLFKMLRAHGIPAQKGWERLHKLRRQIRETG